MLFIKNYTKSQTEDETGSIRDVASLLFQKLNALKDDKKTLVIQKLNERFQRHGLDSIPAQPKLPAQPIVEEIQKSCALKLLLILHLLHLKLT